MQNALAYLKRELGFSLGEWQALDEETKVVLRKWAEEELQAIEK